MHLSRAGSAPSRPGRRRSTRGGAALWAALVVATLSAGGRADAAVEAPPRLIAILAPEADAADVARFEVVVWQAVEAFDRASDAGAAPPGGAAVTALVDGEPLRWSPGDRDALLARVTRARSASNRRARHPAELLADAQRLMRADSSVRVMYFGPCVFHPAAGEGDAFVEAHRKLWRDWEVGLRSRAHAVCAEGTRGFEWRRACAAGALECPGPSSALLTDTRAWARRVWPIECPVGIPEALCARLGATPAPPDGAPSRRTDGEARETASTGQAVDGVTTVVGGGPPTPPPSSSWVRLSQVLAIGILVIVVFVLWRMLRSSRPQRPRPLAPAGALQFVDAFNASLLFQEVNIISGHSTTQKIPPLPCDDTGRMAITGVEVKPGDDSAALSVGLELRDFGAPDSEVTTHWLDAPLRPGDEAEALGDIRIRWVRARRG